MAFFLPGAARGRKIANTARPRPTKCFSPTVGRGHKILVHSEFPFLLQIFAPLSIAVTPRDSALKRVEGTWLILTTVICCKFTHDSVERI